MQSLKVITFSISYFSVRSCSLKCHIFALMSWSALLQRFTSYRPLLSSALQTLKLLFYNEGNKELHTPFPAILSALICHLLINRPNITIITIFISFHALYHSFLQCFLCSLSLHLSNWCSLEFRCQVNPVRI